MRKKGFTLVELLIYIVIMSAMILIVSTFVIRLMQSKAKHTVISEVEQQGLIVMQTITNTISSARAIYSPSVGNRDNQVSIDTIDSEFDPTIFNIDEGRLQTKEGEGDYIYLTNDKVIVSDLDFYNVARENTKDLIKIQFALEYRNDENTKSFEYKKLFYGSAGIR